jgi:SAM-dependent methyltransferase
MDYRDSHLARGATYDSSLAGDPFDAYMASMEAIRVPEVLEKYLPGKAERHLDFACGTGRITAVVSKHARQTVGVDISESMLAQAKSKLPNLTFVHGDLTSDDLGLGEFDLVSSFRFFGNAQPALRDAVIRVLHRHLRPGGHLLINNHRNPRCLAALAGRVTGAPSTMDFTHGSVRHLLQSNGFDLVACKPIATWMFRAQIMGAARNIGRKEQILESLFGGAWLAPIAPDTLILAKKR